MEEIISSNFIHDIIDEDLEKNPELKIHTQIVAPASFISSRVAVLRS